MALQGRVAIVIGGSGGIGASTVRALVARGAHVVVAAQADARLEAIAVELALRSPASLAVAADLCSRADIDNVVARTMERFGRIDALINAAGIGSRQSFGDETDADLERVIAINLLGSARAIHAVLPIMKAQRSGSIINIGSVAGEVGVMGMYSASKFGLRGLTDSLRRELRHDGIGVTLIEPGFVQTTMNPPHPPLPPPEIVSTAILRALERPRRRVIVPRRYLAAVIIATALPSIVDAIFSDPRVRRRLSAGVEEKPSASTANGIGTNGHAANGSVTGNNAAHAGNANGAATDV